MGLFPKHDLGTPILKTISDLVCALAVIIPMGYLIFIWGEIPAQIPSHYNGAGIADSYSSKSMLIFMGFMMIFMYLIMKFASSCPQMWNIGGITNARRPKNMTINGKPFREYTEEEIERAYNLMADMLCWTNMTVTLMFGYMTIQMARGMSLGMLFLPLTLGVMIGSMIYYMVKIYKKNPHKVSDND